MQRRALSLQARQLIAASLGLLAFLALTGFALDSAFQRTAESNLEERMRILAFAYYGGMDFDAEGGLQTPQGPSPDPRFDRPGSGLYAGLSAKGLRWESASSLGRSLPEPIAGEAGLWRFEGPLQFDQKEGEPLRVYQLTQTTIWETAQGDVPVSFAVYQDVQELQAQVKVFRRALWGYLGLAVVLLLLVQTLALRWSLIPLRALRAALDRVQRGVTQRLELRTPRELEPVAQSINGLIESERRNLEQSRNTLADLAHSLKTPLAVLRTQLDAGTDDAQLKDEVRTQVQRMNDIVSYQLARAARSGHALYSAPEEIVPRAEEIVRSLEKVYAHKGVLCEFDIDESARFHGEVGDLQELLGNLLENAFKWAKSRVLLGVAAVPAPIDRRPGLSLWVEDDGPGIAADQVDRLLQRGVRGDERVQGHGVGLAIVQDIARAYRGELKVERSVDLGGARFEIRIAPML